MQFNSLKDSVCIRYDPEMSYPRGLMCLNTRLQLVSLLGKLWGFRRWALVIGSGYG